MPFDLIIIGDIIIRAIPFYDGMPLNNEPLFLSILSHPLFEPDYSFILKQTLVFSLFCQFPVFRYQWVCRV